MRFFFGYRHKKSVLDCFALLTCENLIFQVALDPSGVAEDVKLHGHTGEAKVRQQH